MELDLAPHYVKIAQAVMSSAGLAPRPETELAPQDDSSCVQKSLTFRIVKAEKRLVYGVVLQPEITDAQGDIISAEVIEKAAHNYLAKFGKQTKLGLQHTSFKKKEDRFVLAESYIATIGFQLGDQLIVEGSWIMAVKVLDDEIWQEVQDEGITGFSIGGKARATKLSTGEEEA